ncbi:MAG: hypothetical protein JWO63_1720 [Frankiales bacterium]|jgi:hypothetical protein|nr:hypothetical protein [Frankiales bacterium]
MTEGAESDQRALLRLEVSARPAPSLRPASLTSPEPIRPLPGSLLAKLEVRRRTGFDPVIGADHPRRERLQQVVVLPIVVAGPAAVVAGVGFGIGHPLLGLIAAIVAGVGLVFALAARSWIRADPLRITTAEGRRLDHACSWQSRQPWTGTLNAGPERALLGLAVDAVGAIATSPAWASGYLDGHRLAFDLADELDGLDAQLCQVASARAAGGADDDVDAAFDAGLDRVLALRRYEAGLAALTAHVAVTDAVLHAAPAVGELRGSVEQARFAAEGVQRLTDELAVIIASVDETASELRRDEKS